MGNFRDILESLDVDFQKRDDELDETVSVQDYVDNRLATEFKKNGFNLTKNSFTKKMGYSVWSLEDNYEVINDGVGIKIKKDGKEIEYFDKPKLSYKDAVEFLSKEIMNESKKLQKLQPKDFKKGDKVKWSSAFNSPEKDMEGEVIGFKDHEDYKNGYLIIKGSDKKEYKKIFSGVVRVDEAVIQSQVQKVRGVLGKPSSTSLRGNAEIAVWKFKDGSYIEVDDRETRIYYMDKNRGVIDVYLTANKMKTALFQSGLLESTEDLME